MRLLLGFALGLAVGAAYFGVLWLTVRRVLDARRPGGLVLGSYLARLAMVAAGFYLVVRLGGAGALVAALVGFLAVRQLLVHRMAAGVPDTEGVGWS